MAVNPIFKIKKAFFDQTKIIRMMDNKTKKAFSKYGAYVRRTAQTSMRSRKGSSPVGVPPFAHGQKQLKRLLFFSYDVGTKTVVIGPVLLQRTHGLGVPRIHEFGGVITRVQRNRTVVKRYEERKYMGPAGEKHYSQLAGWFRD